MTDNHVESPFEDTLGLKGLRSMQIQQEDYSWNVLENPTEFYQTLRRLIKSSKNTVILSALYLGNGKLERDLIQELDDALSDDKRPNLQIKLIFDHSRAHRGPNSSLELLTPLIQKHRERIQVFLYEMPQLREFPYNLMPGQLKEVAAVYHCKFGIFDENVIVTGSNLSEEYFVTRQDRYWLLEDKKKRPVEENSSILSFLCSFVDIIVRDCEMLNLDGKTLKPEISKKNSSTFLQELISSSSSSSASSSLPVGINCVPLVQHRSLGIQLEENVLLSLFNFFQTTAGRSSASDKFAVHLSTPYTNFSSQLSEKLVETCVTQQTTVEIIGPDSASHGFASAKGFKSLIPEFHLACFYSSMKAAYDKLPISSISASGRTTRSYSFDHLTHQTFSRPGWTFHAKGLWFENEKQGEGGLPPLAGTYIGSSNFGERSWSRDFELGFLFYENNRNTHSPFREFLQKDLQVLKQHCHEHSDLQQKLASFNPAPHYNFLKPTNIFDLRNLKETIKQNFVVFFAKLIKTYL